MAPGNQAHVTRRVSRVCSIPECERSHYAMSYCFAHYRRLNRGDPVDGKPIRRSGARPSTPKKSCPVAGCGKAIRKLGYCETHADRVRRGVPVDAPMRKPRRAAGVWSACSVDGCGAEEYVRGLCTRHYSRLWRGQPVVASPKPPKPKSPCSITGCARSASIFGMCNGHYNRSRNGTPMDGPIRPLAPRLNITVDSLQRIATERGGKCLSRSYSGSKDKPTWECSLGHKWSAPAKRVNRGHWCPVCSAGRGERVCRSVLELMLGIDLPKQKPSWLALPGGKRQRRLELDGFNETQGIAFEYHGSQHYDPVGARFSQDVVNAIQERDSKKRKLCWERGVKLIVVPELKSRIADVDAAVNQIELAVIQADIKIPKKWGEARAKNLLRLWYEATAASESVP